MDNSQRARGNRTLGQPRGFFVRYYERCGNR
jgi:hypothetical protein